jgi:hypothetical protein
MSIWSSVGNEVLPNFAEHDESTNFAAKGQNH